MQNLFSNLIASSNNQASVTMKSLFSFETIIVLASFFAVWLLALVIYAAHRKNYSKSLFVDKVYVGIIAFLSLIFILVMAGFQAKILYNNETPFRKYQIYPIMAFSVSIAIGLLLYGAIVVIRRYNVLYRDRRSFKYAPAMFVVIGLIIAVVAFVYSELGVRVHPYGLAYKSESSVQLWNETSARVFAYGFSSFIIASFVLQGLKDNQKSITYKYVGNALLTLLFVITLGLLSSVIKTKANLQNDVSGYTVAIIPTIIPIIIFSYKYGFRKSLLISILAGIGIGMSSTDIVAPLELIIKFIIPFAVASFAGPIFGKKNVFLGLILAVIIISALRFLSLFVANIMFIKFTQYTPDQKIIMNSANITWPVIVYEAIVTFVVIALIFILPNARKHLKEERKFNLEKDIDFIQFEKEQKLFVKNEYLKRKQEKKEQKKLLKSLPANN